MKNRLIYILLLILLPVFCAYSQPYPNKNKVVDYTEFDADFLSMLIQEEINEVRDSLHMNAFKFDKALFFAASLQNDYCAKNGRLTHQQKKQKFQTLFKRIRYFDGVHEKVAENLAYAKIEVKESNVRYASLAKQLVQNWIHSKSHFKNITNPEYQHASVAVKLNTKTNRVYVAQVFGSKPFSVNGFQSPAKAYSIVSNDGNPGCSSCTHALDTIYSIGAVVQNGTVYVSMSDLEHFKAVFKGDYYFTADIIFRSQFPCGTYNQLHGSPYHDGYLIKPVSVHKLLRSNMAGETDMFAPIGKLPFIIKEQFEVNLIILNKQFLSKKKALCATIISSPSYGYNLDIMPHTVVADTSSLKNSFLVTRKMKFVIPFEKNKFQYNKSDIQPMIDSIALNENQIKEIKLYTYASVEGGKERNQILQRKRAESILKTFQSYEMDSIRTMVRTRENWGAFRKDLKNTEYDYLLSLEKQEVRDALKNQNTVANLEYILKNHRKAVVYIKTTERIQLETKPEELLVEYKRLLSDSLVSVRELEHIQMRLFATIVQQKLNVSVLDSVSIPKTKANINLINNQISLQYLEAGVVPVNADLEIWDSLAIHHPAIQFNLTGFLIQNWYQNPYLVLDQKKVLSRIKRALELRIVSAGEYYKMMLNFHIAAADHFKVNRDYKSQRKSANYVLHYYRKATLSADDALVLANFLVYHSLIGSAIQILRPYTESADVKEDLLFYYLSLAVYSDLEMKTDAIDRKLELALEMNQSRFCSLFGYPALSFQLMRKEKPKAYYCDNCNDKEYEADVRSIIGQENASPKRIEVVPE